MMIFSEDFVIGALVIRPEILDEIPELSIVFFTSERNKKIFGAITSLKEDGGAISETSVLARLEPVGIGFEILAELQRGIPLKVKASDVLSSIK
jgi:replicative DNA helicase